MKATEFRLGNLAREITHSKNEVVKVSVRHYEDIEQGEIDLFPVHLTEEWLNKFGGKLFGDGSSIDVQGHLLSYAECQESYIHNQTFVYLKYVHQWQNLYFALTGKELEIA